MSMVCKLCIMTITQVITILYIFITDLVNIHTTGYDLDAQSFSTRDIPTRLNERFFFSIYLYLLFIVTWYFRSETRTTV